MDRLVRIEISAGAFLWPAMLLMLIPIQWVAAMLCAGAVHEFCHVAAIYLTGGCVCRVGIGMRGAVIETEPMHPGKELLCALAGPVGSAVLLLLARWFPRLAICGAVHSLYNLLPLFPFDGGRALRSIISLLFEPGRGARVWRCSQIFLRVCVLSVCVILALKYGFVLLFLGLLLFKSTREEKNLANRPLWRYNRGNHTKGYRYDRIETEDSSQRSEACTLYRWGIP